MEKLRQGNFQTYANLEQNLTSASHREKIHNSVFQLILNRIYFLDFRGSDPVNLNQDPQPCQT